MATDASAPVNLEQVELGFDLDIKQYCLYNRDGIPDDHFTHTSPDWEAYDQHEHCQHVFFSDPHNYDAVAVIDCGDADGLMCGTLYNHYFDNCLIWPAAHNGFGEDPLEVLDEIRTITQKRSIDIPVYIADLGPDEDRLETWCDHLSAITTNLNASVNFRDHHQGGEPLADVVDSFVHDEDRSAAQIVRDTDYPNAPDTLQELTDAVGIRDLWDEDHPDFDDYQLIDDAGFYLSFETFAELAVEHGLGLVDANPEIGRELREQYYIGTQAADWVIEHADQYTVETETETYEVMIGYGTCKINIAGHRMIDEHDADIAVIIQPDGTLNFRSATDVPYSERLAAYYGGGGHECAGGADLEWSDSQIDTYRDLRAAPVKERLVNEFGDILVDCPRQPSEEKTTPIQE